MSNQQKEWKHNELAEDLAIVKSTNFLDVPLGSVWLQDAQRADVLEIKPSYTRFCISIFEVKISRADFLSDIRSGKWKGYLEHCHRFYFATPAGMIRTEELPPEAGLIVRGENGWRTAKAAVVQDAEIPITTLMSLIFSKQRLNHASCSRNTLLKDLRFGERKHLYRKFGEEVGDALRNYDDYKQKAASYQYADEEIREIIREELGCKCFEILELHNLIRKIRRKEADLNRKLQETT